MSEPRLKYGQLAPEGLAKMTAFEGFEIPDQTVDSVCDVWASTTLLRTGCGLSAAPQSGVRLVPDHPAALLT